jgi:hypothetical protein
LLSPCPNPDRASSIAAVASISTENRKPTCQYDFWRWVINEGPACKLLYPSHFLTPEDAHAQQIAAQQHISAVMAVEFLTALKVPHGSEFGKINSLPIQDEPEGGN